MCNFVEWLILAVFGGWNAIQYVGSGLTLVAFIAATAAWLYRSRTQQSERLIQTAKEQQRAELVRNALEFFSVDTTGLTKEQQYELAVEQIRARSKRFGQAAVVICSLALVMAGLAGFAIYEATAGGPGPAGTNVAGTQSTGAGPGGGAHDRAVARYGATLGWQLGRFELIDGSTVPEAQQAAGELRRQIKALLLQDKFPHETDGLNAQQCIDTVVSYYGTKDVQKHAFILLGIAGLRSSLAGASKDAANNEEMKRLAISAVNSIDSSVVSDRGSLGRELVLKRPQTVDQLLDVFEKWQSANPKK